MDSDGLIMAGGGLEQVTWMDVRIDKELPTPRHGKPVEINAYWYNGLRILEELAPFVGKDGSAYGKLAEQVKKSFLEKFWMEEEGYLKDVLNGTYEEKQFRCNQVFVAGASVSDGESEAGAADLTGGQEKLYTTAGLRSLEMEDPAFHPWIGGSQPERDRGISSGDSLGISTWGVFPRGAELFPEGGKTGSASRTGASCELDAGRMPVSSGGDL